MTAYEGFFLVPFLSVDSSISLFLSFISLSSLSLSLSLSGFTTLISVQAMLFVSFHENQGVADLRIENRTSNPLRLRQLTSQPVPIHTLAPGRRCKYFRDDLESPLEMSIGFDGRDEKISFEQFRLTRVCDSYLAITV